jgi:hypothetical protein
MILTVNYAMEKLLKVFTKYEKHHSNDGMGNSFFLRLFLLKYINSGAIFLINNNNIILRTLFGIQLSSSPEFTADWYQTVGVTIVLVQLGDIINCHSDSLWKFYIFAKKKSLAINFPEKHLTQDELNQAMIGAKFDMAFKYAQMLSTTFVSLTFASGCSFFLIVVLCLCSLLSSFPFVSFLLFLPLVLIFRNSIVISYNSCQLFCVLLVRKVLLY